jgi:hypothetical protein
MCRLLPAIRKTRCRHDLYRKGISALGSHIAPLLTYRYTRSSGSKKGISLSKVTEWIVKAYPGLCRVEINPLYPLGAGKQLPL